MWKIHFVTTTVVGILLTLSLCNLSHCHNLEEVRKFTTVINPGCHDELYPSNCSSYTNISLIHITSDGKSDSYHFLWSFIGAPTLLMARTKLNTKLSVDWVHMLVSANDTPSINFDPQPFYSFGWGLVKIWIFDDKKNQVTLDKVDQQYVKGFESKNFQWERLDDQSHANSTDIRFTFVARSYDYGDGKVKKLGPNGYFKFTIRMKSFTGYSDILPYMLYSENSTQVDVAFNDVQMNLTESEYPSNPRVGFNYILVQNQYPKNNSERMRIARDKSLDDEHTPGVFETFSVRTPILNHVDQSFIQWKPICYTGEKRDVINSVDVWGDYPLQNASSIDVEDDIQDSILYSYYGKDIDNLLLESMNISFGTKGDGYYNKTKHISWTYSTGFGEPPKDYVSLLVFLVVGIGLGIPTLIIILSVIYVVTKRCKTNRDDLLLGR